MRDQVQEKGHGGAHDNGPGEPHGTDEVASLAAAQYASPHQKCGDEPGEEYELRLIISDIV